MPWNRVDVVNGGQFVLANVVSGWTIDFANSITSDMVMAEVVKRASGWTPTRVEWTRGVFGFGESLRFFGRATATIPASTIAAQVGEALNSFLLINGAQAEVIVSDNATEPAPSSSDAWHTTFQFGAAAVVVIGLVWGIKQIKELMK